jgi:hypothetical protein
VHVHVLGLVLRVLALLVFVALILPYPIYVAVSRFRNARQDERKEQYEDVA